ncbi:DEAD/DEAH box helicase [Jannaschia rubra]|uniref:Transcription-repair-coupling factor n=1 Tax=Jannaschia rubra TaxID=282197 RepID=A0A0M6XMN1_9RHOB|nr:DEAD/DEAH box helicase [Jannaschia rubra]CTQ31284.1 Transcription-repair-coupling factor [Jannaschia rubra]SFF90545.1 CarD-like/TRCF domain-containing protein [Jannaschia rubra]
MAKGGLSDRDRRLLFGDGDLRPGEAVVHFEHGLASYGGEETIEIEGEDQTLHVFIYRHGGKLMLPAEPGRDFWPFGAPASDVTLDRLKAGDWERRRDEMIAELRDGVAKLVEEDRARRENPARALCPPQGEMEDFAKGFAHEPTSDQARAIDAVLDDLARDVPMDRMLIGDVGFGKTEVALRAAAAAAFSGHQVLFAAPTTVLVRQHARTLRERFGQDMVVELSRLTPDGERSEILARIASGEAKVIVGTQALLSDDVTFAALSLAIIDEEQRFGQEQKRDLRGLVPGLHVLGMTATPIPRSLAAAEIGLMDVSVVASAPATRLPVEVRISGFDLSAIETAIGEEIARGGQVFVVCPRIEGARRIEAVLEQRGADFSHVLAHGQMDDDVLDTGISRFMEGDVDVLLSTTIIESGLDNPRANTMIVLDAELFGLAQLHQLRGRIGRGNVAAKMLLMTDIEGENAAAAETGEAEADAARRLQVFAEMSDIGAGFRIAREDRDMRGFGTIDGDEQSGHASRLGIGLYRHILREYDAGKRI